MNNEAMQKLIDHLKAQQKTAAAARFNMRFFGVIVDHPGTDGMLEFPACHTQACLAGEAVLANGLGFIPKHGGIALNDDSHDIEGAAISALGLSFGESERLFFFKQWTDDETNGWPEKFESAYNEAYTPDQRLAVAIDRVQHFIDTNGVE